MMRATRRPTRTVALLVGITLLASACTGDDDGADTSDDDGADTSDSGTVEVVVDDEAVVVDPFDAAGWSPTMPPTDSAPSLHVEAVPVVDRVPPPDLDPTEPPPYLDVP